MTECRTSRLIIHIVSQKTKPHLLFDYLRETLADFNNVWHATSKNWT